MPGEKGVPGPVGPRVSIFEFVLFFCFIVFSDRVLPECQVKLVSPDKQGMFIFKLIFTLICLLVFSDRGSPGYPGQSVRNQKCP